MFKPDTVSRFATWAILHVPMASHAQNVSQAASWDCQGPWQMMHGSGWGLWWIFPVLMAVFMVVAAVMMIRFVMGRGHSHGDDTSSAVRLLGERFARGEISREEFEEKRAILAPRR